MTIPGGTPPTADRRAGRGPAVVLMLAALLRAVGLGISLTLSIQAGLPSHAALAEAAHAAPEVLVHIGAGVLFWHGHIPHKLIGVGLLLSGAFAVAATTGLLGLERGPAEHGPIAALGVGLALLADLMALTVLLFGVRRYRRRALRLEALHIGALDSPMKALTLLAAATRGEQPLLDTVMAFVIAAVAVGLALTIFCQPVANRLRRHRLTAWLVEDDHDA